MRTILVLTALLLLVPAAAEARTLKGDGSAEILRGSARADVIKGRGGNDRLVGRAGNDRLYGGRGADRFNCGPGRDVVHADMADVRRGRIAANCEILRGLNLDVTRDEPAAAPPAGERQAGCKYVTKPVLVLRGGEYVFEQQVVVDCPAGAAPADPPATPASRWEPILPGYWFQYEDFPALYRFRADHTGVRTTYPTGNLSFGTPVRLLLEGGRRRGHADVRERLRRPGDARVVRQRPGLPRAHVVEHRRRRVVRLPLRPDPEHPCLRALHVGVSVGGWRSRTRSSDARRSSRSCAR